MKLHFYFRTLFPETLNGKYCGFACERNSDNRESEVKQKRS
jgi:hypothetical protein